MKKLVSAVAIVALTASAAHAQQPSAGNLEKLSEFRTTGASMEIPHIAQTGAKAEAIKKSLARIKLPSGFKIGLYAIVPDARHMAVGPQGVVVFVGTRKSKVWSVTDRDKDRVADEVKEFAPSIGFTVPERGVLLEGRLPVPRRAEPGAGVPGGRVLLRGPRRGGVRRRQAGRAHPAGRGIVQPYGPRLPRRARRQALHLARPAVQRATRRRRWTSTSGSASAASSA